MAGALALMLISSVMAKSLAAAPPVGPPPADLCDTPGHRQFDFWVGRWDVYREDTNQLVAHSLIEKLYGGCTVRENWQPLQGAGGGSLNFYRPKSGEWRQQWTDSGNNWNEYSGRWTGRVMMLTGTSSSTTGSLTRVRMTYEPRQDGAVVQSGYSLNRRGKSWHLDYQFVYRPAIKP